MSSTLTFSSYFRAQRRKTDRSACALLLSTFPIFTDNVYVQYCILLGDTSVSALSSFRKDPKWGVKKLRAKKMMRRRKVNKNKFLRTKVIKTVTFVIKRLVSGGYNDTCSPPATCPRSLVTSKHLLSVSVDTSLLSVSADTYSPSTNLSNLSSPSQSSSRYTRRTRWTASISRAATSATRTRTRTKGSGWTALTPGAAPSVDQNSDPDWKTQWTTSSLNFMDSFSTSSISVGPSGLATHCIGMSCPFSPSFKQQDSPRYLPDQEWIGYGTGWYLFIV